MTRAFWETAGSHPGEPPGIDHTNNGLSPLRYVDVLDSDELRPTVPQPAQCLDLHAGKASEALQQPIIAAGPVVTVAGEGAPAAWLDRDEGAARFSDPDMWS